MSTATANGTPLRDLTAPERKAVELRGRGATDAAIRIETGLTVEQVDIALERYAAWEKLGGKTTVTAAERPTAYRTTTVLLAWAETSGVTRAITLAARIRKSLAELRSLQEQSESRVQAQADVDRLAAELEAAKARLKKASGITTRPGRTAGAAPDGERREQLAAIRAWAPGAGFEVAPLGRIPKRVQDAYDAAHGATS